MRSLATNSSASPTAYRSRTLPRPSSGVAPRFVFRSAVTWNRTSEGTEYRFSKQRRALSTFLFQPQNNSVYSLEPALRRRNFFRIAQRKRLPYRVFSVGIPHWKIHTAV